jgi:hypothetical protein
MKVLAAEKLNPEQRQFIESLGISLDSGYYETKRKPNAKHVTMVFQDVYAIGRPIKNLVNLVMKQRILAFVQVHPQSLLLSFTRAFLNEETLMGTAYTRSQKRSNSVVAYHPANQPDGSVSLAEIHSFHMVTAGHFTYLVAVAKEVRKVENSVVVNVSQRTTPQQREAMNRRFFEVFKPV